jgi:RNA polymerase sigma factor (sigma-70 family)
MPGVPPRIVGQLRQAALADAGLSDGQLLDAYLARRDEAAFECLVWRHGPAVLGACRRFLGHDADAEDAFQATFLVLVRKAQSVRRRGTVGAWLYGVACNVARKSRANALRRRAKELAAQRTPSPAPTEPDVRPMIDDEVNRLPEKYRVPIVLCELEGQQIADAARQLGWPQGTLASRLARGRDLLARRLARRGLSLVSLSAAALTADTVAGALQAIREPAATANRLADGVVRTMSLSSLKPWAVAVACAATLLIGGVAYQMGGHDSDDVAKADPPPKAPKAEPAPKTDPEPKPPRAEIENLIGRWRIRDRDRTYRVLEFRDLPGQGLMIAEKANHDADWFSWKIDATKEPKQIDLYASVEGKSNPNFGIYKFEGDRLILYLGAPLQYQGDPGTHWRPTSFETDDRAWGRYFVLERETVAWSDPRPDGLQFGLLAEPNGRRTVEIGDTVSFRVYVRNTTNKGIDVDLPKTDGIPPVWEVNVRDGRGAAVRVAGPPMPEGGPALAPTRVTKKMLDYRVADLGTIRLTFRPPADVKRWPNEPYLVPADPGTYTVRFAAPKTPSGEVITGEVTLKVESTVAWGRVTNGLQFGLAFGKDQPSRIHVGERARFRVLARNTTDATINAGTLQVLHLPMYATPTVVGSDWETLQVKEVRGPQVSPPPPNLKVGAKETFELPGEFVLPFLPHAAAGETHVVAKPGRWKVAIPKLDTWTAGAGWGTGGLEIEIVAGDVAHTDSQRAAWGPVAEGLQFGLRPDKAEYTIGDTVKFAVHARNMSNKAITFAFPTLSGWWPNNGRPAIRDADGKEIKPHLAVPAGPIGPQAVTQHTLKPGDTAELVVVQWPFIETALPGMYQVDHVVLDKPGTYTFQYPDLHGGIKPAWPTGAAKLSFVKPAAPKKDAPTKPDAERIVERWSIAGEKTDGKPVREGKYRIFEFRMQPTQGLLIAQDATGKEHWFTWKIDEKQSPKTIDLWARVPGLSSPNHGVYEFNGDRLRIGLGAPFRFQGDPGKHTRPATFDAAAHVIELEPSPIAWGAAKDGLQYGLVLASGQSSTARIGESIRFQLYIRNTTDTEKVYETRKLDTLQAYAGVRASRGDKQLKSITAQPPGGLPKPDRFTVAAKAIQTIGEFTVLIAPNEDRNLGAHVVGEPGKWEIDVPDLNGWLTHTGHSTGRVQIELVR